MSRGTDFRACVFSGCRAFYDMLGVEMASRLCDVIWFVVDGCMSSFFSCTEGRAYFNTLSTQHQCCLVTVFGRLVNTDCDKNCCPPEIGEKNFQMKRFIGDKSLRKTLSRMTRKCDLFVLRFYFECYLFSSIAIYWPSYIIIQLF